ncbi:hypothetical protein ABFS82_06G019600 [Erythranthe guttata]|uniref:Uncharacterized protein n=1 Tax=Erythranthe guttata TaxID=4155 RepID=A0A022QFE5_ERYGU|nr:PREDICTED: nephrocystin-3 [Erythranthe guttata]EYU25245.1 hypothetical protein MIMGU_mgv1a003668mg [Erythranthe guttata]|eukprot:XP_012852155.1 PREDICTED: nephrocystin-3 [Erythranthe guttata]
MASAFSSSTSAASLRMNPMCLETQFDYLKLQKMFMFSSSQMIVRFPKCNLKLYMVPCNQIYGRSCMRSSAVGSSSEIRGKHDEGRATSSVFGPNNFRSSNNDLEEQLEELFNEVKTMIKLGKDDDAVDLLQANYEAVKEQVDSGAQGIEEAAVLDVIALGYMALGDLKTVGFLMDVLNKIVNELKDEELLLDSILMHMGSMYSKLENVELSICFYRRSVQIMEKKYGTRSSLLCTPLMGMAKVQGTCRKSREAIKTYQRVVEILESSRGGETEDMIAPLCSLGNLLIKEGRNSDAEYTFNRVLNIYTRSYGERDGRVGMAMYSLAQVKCAKGQVNEAIDLYKSAIQILKDSKHMELDDGILEKMRIDLAELLHVVGRGEEGRALLEECFLISEKLKGKENPSSVPHLVNLATSYSRSKNFAEAERLLRISLQIMMKTVPPDDPSITFPMLNLAVTLYNLHRDEEAERLALDALSIREKAFGKESLPVGEALDCLVSIQTRLEKDDTELLELLKRVLKIQEKTFGHDSEEVMETLKKTVHYLDKMGMKNEKYPLQKKLSILRNKHKQMAKY